MSRPVTWLTRSTLWGLTVATAVVLALSAWLHASVGGDLAAQQKQREAVLVANAIGASLAGVNEETAAARINRWKQELPRLQSALVVAGRQLLASTRPADEAPRALKREEKPLFDLATALRSAGETNVSEGAVRKKTVQVDDSSDGAVTVTVPYVVDGKFEGIVQVRIQDSKGETSTLPDGGWVLALGLLAPAVIGRFLRVQPERRFDIARGLAVLALLTLAIGFQQQRLGQMAEATAAANLAISKVQAGTAAVYSRIGAAAQAAGTPSTWDTDAYGRPLKLISSDGRLLATTAAAQKDAHTRFLERSFWGVNLVGVLLLLFFVQGYAARTATALRDHAD
ncbi:MAG TPA: hypothetical protein VGP22_00955, partial [Albitalea sp.]|nr:hypothetical protein [Albitalea sp.]